MLAYVVGPLVVSALLIPYLQATAATSFWFLFSMVVTTLVSCCGAVIFGILRAVLLRQPKPLAVWTFALLGLCSGALTWILFVVVFALMLGQGLNGISFGLTNAGTLKGILSPGGVMGSIGGTVFWLIARPDRTVD